ncbi:MaoC family dehydratase [Hyphomonas sp.]|uniref:MaoC family dehydratase n=1 Tax=Hyphomonas sp. TaxID=87 RepID=UPI00391CCB2B
MSASVKSNTGNFFEDFRPGQTLVHATPQTLTEGDVALYRALTGGRYAQYSSAEFAKAAGLPGLCIDPLHAFHVVFGKTVPDVSLNAVANLGYADGRFLRPVMPGDTLRAVSEVIGRKENSTGRTGVVWVRTTGLNQREEEVLSYVRWVMVNKRDPETPSAETVVPELREAVPALALAGYPAMKEWDFAASGSRHVLEDYEIGERINHVDGMTVQEAEHQTATRLYQNTAKVHFDFHGQKQSRFGKRLVYGGVVISIARSLAFNGLGNAGQILAINGGTHAGPLFAWDTIYAWSEVLDKAELSETCGALRLRLVAVKDTDPGAFAWKDSAGKYDPAVLLDFDYWAAIPRAR